MPAGYSGTPLVKKLGLKAGYRILLINIPEHYWDLLETVPEDVVEAGTTDLADFMHLFVTSQKELPDQVAQLKARLQKTGMLWISWPKGASKIPKDLNETDVRRIGLQSGLVDVKVCAIDADWSGLKFMYRLKDR